MATLPTNCNGSGVSGNKLDAQEKTGEQGGEAGQNRCVQRRNLSKIAMKNGTDFFGQGRAHVVKCNGKKDKSSARIDKNRGNGENFYGFFE